MQGLLSDMAGALAHEHPDDPPPAQLRTMGDRQSPDPVHAHFDRQAGVVAVEPDPVWAPSTVGPWLADRVGRLASHEAVAADFEALLEVMAEARRLAPVVAARPVALPVVPCPSCHEVRLEQHPGADRVECAACGEKLTPAGYRAWVRRAQPCS